MAATLLLGALSFHVGVQRQPSYQELQGDSVVVSASGSCRASSSSSSSPCMADAALSMQLKSGVAAKLRREKTSAGGLIASSRLSCCLPLFLSAGNLLRQQTRTNLFQQSRNRVRSVRVASLNDSQREVLHEVDDQSKPIELFSPTSANEDIRSKGKEAHSSKSPTETADLLATQADEEGVNLKEEAKAEEEDVSGTVKGTIIATTLLLAFVGAFGVLGAVYKEQINDILTQFSDFLEGQSNSSMITQSSSSDLYCYARALKLKV